MRFSIDNSLPRDHPMFIKFKKMEQADRYDEIIEFMEKNEVVLNTNLSVLLVILLAEKGEFEKASDILHKELNQSGLVDGVINILHAVIYSEIVGKDTNQEKLEKFVKAIDIGYESLKNMNITEMQGIEKYEGFLHKVNGNMLGMISQPEEAIKYYNKALDIFKIIANNKQIARIYINIGNMNHMKGNLLKALVSYEKALSIAKTIKNLAYLAGLYNNLGVINRILGNLDKSINYYQESLILAEKSESTEQISALLNNIGVIYFFKGELNESIIYYKRSLAIRKRLRNIKQIASSYDNIGEAYQKLGRLNTAIEYLQFGLELRRNLKIGLDLANSLENIGTIYRIKGDMDLSIKYYNESLSLKENLGNNIELSKTLFKLGRSYQMMGEYETAIEYLLKSLSIRINTGNEVEISANLFELFIIYYELKQIEDYNEIMEKLNVIQKTSENDLVKIRYRLIEAKLLKSGNRIANKVKAQKIFSHIAEQIVIDFELTLFAILNQYDILLYELKISEDVEVITDLEEITERILFIAREQDVFSLLAEGLLLKSKIQLLKFDLTGCKELLSEALETAERFDLKLLASKIYSEQNKLENNYNLWIELFEKRAPLGERMELIDISGYIHKMVNKQQLEHISIQKEKPVMIIISSNLSGLSLYSKNFNSDKKLDENLVSSFISAMNAFGKEAFSIKSNIDKIKQGIYSLVLQSYENISIMYAYTNESYNAILRLNQIVEELKNNKLIWHNLQNFRGNIDLNINPVLDEIVENIFYS